MNTEPFNENESSARDEFGDEQFLQEFNRELWHLFKRADDYNQQLEASHEAELLWDDDATEDVAPDDSARRCLSIVRCAAIGEQVGSATETEKAHLRDCRYCERVVLRFAGQTQAAHVAEIKDADTPETPPPVEPKHDKTWREWLFTASGEVGQGWFGSPPAAVGVAILLLVALSGAMFMLVLFNSPGRDEIARSHVNNAAEGPTPPPQSSEAPSNSGSANLPPPTSTPSTSPTPTPTPSAGMATAAVESKGVKEQNPPNERRASINEGLRAVRDYAGIPLPEDVRSFFAKLRTVRRAGDEPTLLSPNREAIVEDQPTFRWASRKGTSFKIIVRDEGKKQVAHGEQLTGHTWVIPKKLPPGIYYWEIYAFDKDGSAASQTQVDAIFKVVDKAEVERVRSLNSSHMDKALYFINVGLLKDAEIELEAELKKNPRSRKARNILRQVRGWQRQLRVT